MSDVPGTIDCDAVVIGAGPVGLFQAFQLGLLEIKTHVIDSLPYAGGQCIELYPDKPIYDIPAVPVCTGRELTASLLKQIEPFGATLHLGEEVGTVARQADGRFLVQTARGRTFLTKVVVIAGGVGAFQPRRLKVEGIDAFEANQLFYQRQPEPLADQDVVIVGGDEAAVQAALDAVNGPVQARSVILLHRRDVLQASATALAEMQALREAGLMRFEVGQITGFEEESPNSGERRLTGVRVTDVDAATYVLPVNQLLVYLGLSPKLGPIAEWGLAMERKQLQVDTESFCTTEPGIFAVGDINTYPGKKKLIVCGFHECVLAAFGAAAVVFPDRKTPLQYTTTSPRLHQLLGVTSEA